MLIKSASVNATGQTNAESRIRAGHVNTDAAWSFDASDGNPLLGTDGNDWSNYGKWFLGADTSAQPQTKDRFKYPFGKGGVVYRSALIAIRQRSAQQEDKEVFAAAGALIEMIDAKKAAPATHRAYAILTVKSANDEQRIVEGIATTPTADLYSD